ncbi:hypothetical protein Amuc_2007 [Akkermansia muciniphila ATCC BAA-835]|uniref:Uncharacterized protein n=1 Tax=Akkermansia muciniphila (strain ATCC BAA-835 / DSM 22959 / JCM 33894 / BCRC 81048 / CCUG 64013 / CIP 107961 / Muc) TaxID=349741 RepID=B2UP46_AKKM8|nr:hypothetical protein Amuc_2007 [Akkermansia muciniphila ATCC BAA-835]
MISIIFGIKVVVLCLILDSRQNMIIRQLYLRYVVLCLILDSRQNQWPRRMLRHKLYCALFWIQGKTAGP